MLKNAPILLLDEATSALDSEVRTASPSCARRIDPRAHDPGHCAPALDRPERRPDLRSRSRADRRERPACGIDRARRAVCPPLFDAVRGAAPRGGSAGGGRVEARARYSSNRAPGVAFSAETRLRRAACWVIHCYIRIVYRTTNWQIEGAEWPRRLRAQGKPFILAFWHGRLLMIPMAWQRLAPMHMLISAHPDGQIIADAVTYFGVDSIAGSTQPRRVRGAPHDAEAAEGRRLRRDHARTGRAARR